MESHFSGYLLVLMLLGIHWSVVLPAEVKCSCILQQLYHNTALLVHNAEFLQTKYEHSFQPRKPTLSDIPSDTVNGTNFTEKLQDIYIKNLLFQAHLQQVEKYIQALNRPLLTYFLEPKERLKQMCAVVKYHIKNMNPSMPVLTTPESVQQPNRTTYYQKRYGWAVIKRLVDWGKNVNEVIIKKCSKEQCTLET